MIGTFPIGSNAFEMTCVPSFNGYRLQSALVCAYHQIERLGDGGATLTARRNQRE
jgi:hypothetical protein